MRRDEEMMARDRMRSKANECALVVKVQSEGMKAVVRVICSTLEVKKD